MVKNPPASSGAAGDLGSSSQSGRSPGVGNGNLLQSLAWIIQGTEEPGGLQPMESQTAGQD